MYFCDYGAYLYIHENQIYHFIYIKTTFENVKKLFLADSTVLIKPFICIFYDPYGDNYLGHLEKSEIKSLIRDNKMINILENDCKSLNNYISLSDTEFNEFVSFSEDVIKSLY